MGGYKAHSMLSLNSRVSHCSWEVQHSSLRLVRSAAAGHKLPKTAVPSLPQALHPSAITFPLTRSKASVWSFLGILQLEKVPPLTRNDFSSTSLPPLPWRGNKRAEKPPRHKAESRGIQEQASSYTMFTEEELITSTSIIFSAQK